MIITIAYLAMSLILYVNAELSEWGEPFPSDIVGNKEVDNCDSNKACKVYYNAPLLVVNFNYTVSRNVLQLIMEHGTLPECEISISAASKSLNNQCSVSTDVEERKEHPIPSYGYIKFNFKCSCGIVEKFEKGEKGTFIVTLWLFVNGEPQDHIENIVHIGDRVKGDLVFVDVTELEESEKEDEEED